MRGMGRFYLIATLIVVAIGSVVFAHRLATLRDFDVRAQASGTPTPTRGGGDAVPTPSATFSGDGPWVLSALPSCFVQQSSIVGTTAQLTYDVPPASERIPPGTTLHRGSCTLRVREHDIWVIRGSDRLRVPPEARLYRTKKGLTLVYERDGRMEIRVY